MMSMQPVTLDQITNARAQRRGMRMPTHTFYTQEQPFCIHPFFIAPVFPNETLENLSMQCRSVTDPILNPIIGWHREFYFFYVKLTDLQEEVSAQVPGMLIDPNWSGLSAITAAQGTTAKRNRTFYPGGATMVDWVELCRRVCVRHYFRDEKDDYNTYVAANGEAYAQYNHKNWLDSALNDASVLAVDIDVDGPDANTTIQASEMYDAMMKWQALQINGLMEMTFEQYLETEGVRQPAMELHRPELVRYERDWQYPSNTIDPTNGAARSAVSWSINMRADKKRYFKEPGFLFGLSVTRPKVYVTGIEGTISSALNSQRAWLAPWLRQKGMFSSFVKVPDGQGPLTTASTDTGGYWFDVKDLLRYGEAFLNMDTTTVNPNKQALSTTWETTHRYPSATADIEDRLFVTPASAKYVRSDGIVSLRIATFKAPVDTSPRGGQVLQLL